MVRKNGKGAVALLLALLMILSLVGPAVTAIAEDTGVSETEVFPEIIMEETTESQTETDVGAETLQDVEETQSLPTTEETEAFYVPETVQEEVAVIDTSRYVDAVIDGKDVQVRLMEHKDDVYEITDENIYRVTEDTRIIDEVKEYLGDRELFDIYDINYVDEDSYYRDSDYTYHVVLKDVDPVKDAVLLHFMNGWEYDAVNNVETLEYQYDDEKHEVSFETKSFSPFAFVEKAEEPVDEEETVVAELPEETSEGQTIPEQEDIAVETEPVTEPSDKISEEDQPGLPTEETGATDSPVETITPTVLVLDADGNHVSGVVFELFTAFISGGAPEKGDSVEQWNSTFAPYVMSDLDEDTWYCLQVVAVPDGMHITEDALYFKITEDGVKVAKDADGWTVRGEDIELLSSSAIEEVPVEEETSAVEEVTDPESGIETPTDEVIDETETLPEDTEGEPTDETDGDETDASVEETTEATETETSETETTVEDEETVSLNEKAYLLTERCENVLVTVRVPEKTFPVGTVMKVVPVVDENTLDAIKNSVEGDGVVKIAVAVDISFWDGETEVEPLNPISVAMISDNIAASTEAESEPVVLHVDNDNVVTEVEQKAETPDDTVMFDAGSFSVYAVVYTVEFTYDGYKYCLPGNGSILLSELLPNLGIDENVTDAISVVSSNDALLGVEAIDNDWRITSKQSFETKETLTIMFNDGAKYIIDIKDPAFVSFDDTNMTFVNANYTKYFARYAKMTTLQYRDFLPENTMVVEKARIIDGVQYYTIRQILDGYHSYWILSNGVEFGLTEYDPDDIRDECLWAFYGDDSDGTEFYIYNYNAQKYLTNTLTFSEEMTADTLWHCYKMPCVAMFHRDPVGSYGSWKGTGSKHSTWPNNGRDVNYIWIDTEYNGKAIAYPRNWSNDDPLKNKPSYSSLSGQASPCGRSHIFSSTMSDEYVIPSNYTVYWAYDDVSIYAENMIPASYAADGTGEADTDGVVNYTSSFFAHRYHAGLLDCYPVFVPHDGVSFTIQLNDNGGTGGSKSFKGTSDGTAITYSVDSVNVPTKDGYSFAGYYTPTYKGERIQVFDELGNMVLKGSELKGTMTLKAEWIALDVTVHYDVQGANLSAETPQPADTQTGIGLKVELPEVKDANQSIPWGQNYFLGWSLTPDGSSGLLPADFKITDEIFHEYGHDNTVTLYAIWGPQTLVIHLEQANQQWYPNEDGIESMHVDNYFTIKATDFTYHAANGVFGEWWEGTVTLPDLPEGITSYKHYTYTGRWYSLENPYVANLNFNQTMTYNYYELYEKFVDPDKGLNEVTLSANWDADAYKIQYYVGNGYMRNDEPTIVDVTAPFTVYGSNAVAPQDGIDAKLVGWATSYESNEVIPVVNDWSNYTNTFYRQKFLDAHQWARNSENIYLAGGTYWPEDHYDDVDADGTPIIKLYAIYASVDFDRGLINTVDSKALGWNIDLYDYDSPQGMNDTSNIVYNPNAEAFPVVQGINRGTTGGFANPMQSFLFTGYGSSAINIYNETRRLSGEGVTKITPNTYVAASCIQGILQNRLDEKHMPILYDGQSLAYLFNEKNETTYGGKNYTSLNHLFYQQARTLYKWGAPGSYTYPAGMDANNVTRATLDDVYADGIFLEYDSSEHYALLNKETGDFDVFAGTYDNSNDGGAGDNSDIRLNQGIGFFPLTEPNVSRDNISYNDYYNHHFGMHMYCNYINPTDMKITNADGSKTDMIFEFSGDDDLWVFFDDQLVLDLGGVHQPISGRINFTTGEVMIKEGYVTVGGTANYAGESSSLFVVNDPQPSLDQVVDASVLEPGTVHRVDIFFIERGGQFSNMHMLTNIIPMPAQQSVVVDKVDENGEHVVGAVMQILNSEGHVLDEWTTDSHGSHASVISVMEVSQDDGSYRSDDGSRHFAYYGETLTLHEKTAPAGYTVAEDQSFKLADNFVEMQTIYLTMVDKVAGLHVKKTWSGEGGIPVDSVEIEVYREIGSYGDFTQARVDVFDNYNFDTVEGQITNTTSVRTVYLPMGTPDNPHPFTVWDKYNKWGGIIKMPDATVTVKDMVTGDVLGTAVVLLEREPYANTSGSNMYSGNDYHFLVDYEHLTQTTGTIMDIFQYGPDRDIVIELDPIALPRDTQSMGYQGVADVYTCVGGFEHWGGRDIDGPHASTDSSIYYNEHVVSQWDEVTDDEYPMTLELTADDNWEYTIPGEGFVRIAPDGRPYRYGVREKTVGNWVSTVSDPVVGGGDVTIDNEVPESNNVRIRKQTGYGNIDNYELEPWDSESEVTFPVQIFFLNENEEYELYTGDAWYDNDNNVETDDVKQTPVQLELADGTVLDGVFYIKTSEWLVIKDVDEAVPYYVREIADSDSVFASSYTKYTSTAKSNRDDWYVKADVDYSAYDLYSVVIADEHQHYVTSTDRDVVIRNLTDYPNVPDAIKIDKNTQEPIAGAQFWLIDESMERIALLESDADGKLADSDGKTFKDYLVDGGFGQYILSEFKAPANYELSENDITISYSRTEFAVSGENAFVNDNGVYLYITNEKGTTEVKFDKVNGVTKESLAGAVLQILDADKNVLYEWTSDGTVYVAELGLGATYTLHEKTAPEGYAKADDIKFTVSADGVVTVDDEEVEVVVMKDYERISLPSTGSTTSIILMVVGAIVIVGGGLFLLLSKRKKDDEDDD